MFINKLEKNSIAIYHGNEHNLTTKRKYKIWIEISMGKVHRGLKPSVDN
jgi:hypothetical protein